MTDSILDSTKHALGLDANYDVFDQSILMHINSTFLTLNQLGVGPVDGFMIEDADATWNSFLSNNRQLNAAKSYMYLKVRLLFDPPGNSFLVASMEKQIQELEWRLNFEVESRQGTVTTPVVLED